MYKLVAVTIDNLGKYEQVFDSYESLSLREKELRKMGYITSITQLNKEDTVQYSAELLDKLHKIYGNNLKN